MGNVEGFESLYSICVIPNLLFFFFVVLPEVGHLLT